MGVKVATFYLASIATSLLAANQVAPIGMQDGRAKNTILSEKVVNRPLKTDRLPIRQVTPQTDVQERLKAPAIPKAGTDCKPPVEIPGRCFA